jgi:hypothetical protein
MTHFTADISVPNNTLSINPFYSARKRRLASIPREKTTMPIYARLPMAPIIPFAARV